MWPIQSARMSADLAEWEAGATHSPIAVGGRPLAARISVPALVVVGLMIAGAALRVSVIGQSLFADELSTYWISATHSLGGVVSLMYGTPHIPHPEITPPLYFLLAWATSQFGHAPALLRLPSLIAGVLTIPAVYLLGLRTVGRRAALLAATLTTLSPFMIYYSTEARSYGVMMLLTTLSTLAMLLAVDTRRRRWWVAYAVCVCGAFYSHYTCFFVLLVQLAWLLWAHPEVRRPALIANLAAAVAVLPWLPGLINDLDSPTTKILSALSPFTAHDVRISLEHWAIGFPYVDAGGLHALPGTVALVALAGAAVAVVAGLARAVWTLGARRCLERIDRRVVLIFGLALSVPVGEAVVSAVSTHLFGVRNLAASWPALALAGSALAVAAGPWLGYVAAVLGVTAFALASAKMLTTRFARPDYRGAARYAYQHAGRNYAIVDGTGFLSPGPLTGFDLVARPHIAVIRAGSPAERGHPFGTSDAVASNAAVISRAVTAARGGRVIVVAYKSANPHQPPLGPFPPGYHLVAVRRFPQFVGLEVDVWGKTANG